MDLKKKAFSAVKWTGLSSLISAAVQFLQLGIFARLLSPKEFGLFAIAFVIIGLSQLVLDMGTSNAIIYKQNISKKELDSLYIFNLIIGFLLFLILVGGSYPIAAFYNENELVRIIQLSAFVFIIQAIGQQFYVMLKKEMRFNEIAKRDIFSKIANLLISTVLALLGYGVYAMVWGYVGGYIVNTLFLIIVGWRYHKPRPYFSYASIKPFLSFGMFQMGESFLNYFNTNLDSLLIGRLLGATPLGIFNVAKNLSIKPYQIINPIITQVAFPLMAQVQYNNNQLKSIFQRMLNTLSSVNIPLYLVMIILAKPILSLTLGTKWEGAAFLFQLLSAYGMLRAINNPIGALLLAKGKVKFSFGWNLSLFILTPLAIFISSKWGVSGIAVSLIIIQFIFIFIGWKLVINALLSIPFMDYIKDIYRPLLCSLIMCLFCLPLELFTIDPIVRIILTGAIALISYITSSKVINPTFFADLEQQYRVVTNKVYNKY